MDINGNWEGTIVFGKEYGKNVGEKVEFRSEITQINNSIHGLSYDLSGTGVNPDPADFKGKIEGDKISFIKQYRTRHYLVGDTHEIDSSRKGAKIAYEGTFDKSTNSFSGDWTMGVSKKFFGLIPLNVKSTGTWTMKRK